MSGKIGELSAALSKAQGHLNNAHKSSSNPFFKSKYADLAACLDAAKQPLADNGLAVIQLPYFEDGFVGVKTLLTHESGEWISSNLKISPAKTDPQGTGGAITYARRYSFCAMVGLAQTDDDGEAHRQVVAPETGELEKAIAAFERNLKVTRNQLVEKFGTLTVESLSELRSYYKDLSAQKITTTFIEGKK